MAAGPAGLGRRSARWLTGLLTDEAERGLVEPHLVPLAEVDAAPAVRGRRLRRLLRLARPRLQRRPDLPPRPGAAAAQLAAPAGRLPRPRRHRRRSAARRSSGRAGQRKAPGRGRPDVRAEPRGSTSRPSSASWSAPAPRSASRSPRDDFADHVFGVVGLNDWSARDIQAWEYVPLGPFLGKSFATSISPWVTPLAALDAAWVDLPGQDPEPLPYLAPGAARGLDIDVEVVLNGEVVSRPPYRTMYWSPAQMLAHLTVNGASLRTGDLFASGTISGPEPRPARLVPRAELGRQGAVRRRRRDRTFLEDGDEVVLRYTAPGTARRPDRPRRGRRPDRSARPLTGHSPALLERRPGTRAGTPGHRGPGTLQALVDASRPGTWQALRHGLDRAIRRHVRLRVESVADAARSAP